ERQPDAMDLGRFVKLHGVDTLWLTAGLFNSIIDTNPAALYGVRQLLTGGEAMSVSHARKALASLPDTTIINGYGPTETTTFATTYRLPRELPDVLAAVPIGRPLAHMRLFILDNRLRPVPVGMVGELYISGAGVARGYLNSPELTASKFIS